MNLNDNAIMTNKNEYEDLINQELSNRFIYQKGDIKISKIQCEFCKYNEKEQLNVCSQYPNGKPDNVVSNIIRCPKMER